MKQLFSIIILFAIFLFIFSQAGAPYNVEQRSSEVLAQNIHDRIIIYRGVEERSVPEVELIIRKLAHLLEYYLLTTVVLLVITGLIKNGPLKIILILLMTLPVPFIDEFLIQAAADGRSVQLFDVMIDYLGILLALVSGGVWMIRGWLEARKTEREL